MSAVELTSPTFQVDLRVRRSANLTLYRLWQLPLVDVWELLNGFLFRSPAGNARRLIARAPCQRQHPIVHDRSGSGACSSRCVPVRPASPGNSPARSRGPETSPATLQQNECADRNPARHERTKSRSIIGDTALALRPGGQTARRLPAMKPYIASTMIAPTTEPTNPALSPALYQLRACPR